MTDSLKVQSQHLQRDAYLYIRQSSMRQVVENIESLVLSIFSTTCRIDD